MSKFVVRHDFEYNEGYELEIHDAYAPAFAKYYQVIDEPTGLRPVKYMEGSSFLSKSKPLDFGDNPVVVNL
jgi:hypothetical protein